MKCNIEQLNNWTVELKLPNLISLECWREKSGDTEADLMKSSVWRSSICLKSPDASCIRLPLLKAEESLLDAGLSSWVPEDIGDFGLSFDVIIKWDIGKCMLTMLGIFSISRLVSCRVSSCLVFTFWKQKEEHWENFSRAQLSTARLTFAREFAGLGAWTVLTWTLHSPLLAVVVLTPQLQSVSLYSNWLTAPHYRQANYFVLHFTIIL